MKEKYLPLGSICSIKGNPKSVMIIGYFSTEYNGGVKIYDYQGCTYPEGMLVKNKQISFNHSDIEKVEFEGYRNDLFNNLNNILLNDQVAKEGEEYSSKGVFDNFVFDENGVVIMDNTVSAVPENSNSLRTDAEQKNPFEVDSSVTQNVVANDTADITNKYVFDENGVVIADNIAGSVPKYQFDENGVVTFDPYSEEIPAANENGYAFDENGVVTADLNANPLPEATDEIEMPKEKETIE